MTRVLTDPNDHLVVGWSNIRCVGRYLEEGSKVCTQLFSPSHVSLFEMETMRRDALL